MTPTPDPGAAGRPARGGRRPGQSSTRDDILAAARARFAEAGFDRASIRSIAAEAGVDPALVHHYFGTKQQLFTACINMPVDPAIVIERLRATDIDQLGRRLVATLIALWDSPGGESAVALLRSVIGSGDATLVRTFLLDVALKETRERVDTPRGSGKTRVAAVVSHMVGLLITRKILRLEPIASMSADALAELVGPVVQHYLTGELASTPEETSR